MHHKKAFRKFGLTASHRRAMFRNLVTSLLRRESIETTLQRAKELRSITENLIRTAAQDTLHARKKAYAYILDKQVVHHLFTQIGPNFKNREGGYTRVVRTRFRKGDAAQMAVIELVERSAVPFAPRIKVKKGAHKVDKKKEPSNAEGAAAAKPAKKAAAKPAVEAAALKKGAAKKPAAKKSSSKAS